MTGDLRKDIETAAKTAAARAAGHTRRVLDRVNERLGVVPDKGELHTKPDVAHIAGIGEKSPERLTSRPEQEPIPCPAPGKTRSARP